MVWWVKLIIMVVASYIGAALAPKPPQPKPAGLDKLDVPQADEGRAIGMVFGHVIIKAATLAWFGNLTTEKIKVRTGNIFGHTKQTVGFRYKMGLHFALCRTLDRLDEIIAGERVCWRGPLSASGESYIGQWELFGGDKREGGIQGYFDFLLGDAAQDQNDYLVAQLGDLLPAYRGVVSVVFKGGRVSANSPYIKPWWFRGERIHTTHDGSTQWYDATAAIPIPDGSIPIPPVFIMNGSFDVNALTNAGTTATAMKAVAAYDLQASPYGTLQINDVVYLYPSQGGAYLGWSRWGDPDYSGGDTGSTYILHVVKDDGTTASELGPAGSNHDGYQAAFDAAVAGMPYSTTGATRYRFGVVDNPTGDNSGGMSWYFEVWRDDTTTYNAMNPAHIIRECLTDPYMRMAYPESMIDDDSFTAAADTFYNEGMGLCLFWANQTTVKEFIQTVLDHCGAVYYADPFTGKFILKAIRGDYDVDDLPAYDESSIISVESFERSGPGEIVNEVSVQYFDIATGKDALLTVQDLASVNSQGSIVAETRQYPGLSHPALAARVAQRDLTASTAALARIHVRFTRAAATIRPGDVIKLSWAKLGISSLVCRVLDVSYGGLNNGEIRAELAEDVFGLPSSSYQEDQPTGWAPGSDDPAPVADQYVMEGTYWDISHDMNPADVAALSDTSGFLYTLAEAENAAQYSHGIYSRIAPADFTLAIDEQPFALKTQLAVSVIRSDTEIEVDDTGNGEFGLAIAVGDRLILPGGTTEEQMEVTDLTNLATGIIGVNRAILDTTPQEIANGTDVWLLEYTEEDFGRDGVERFDGDTVDYKLTSTSSTGESPPELAPVQTLTYDSRLFRPYPPGKIRIEGEAFPAGDVLPGFTLDWAHRDRLQQTSAFVAQDDDSIGPEAGTTYNVYFYDDDTDTLKHTELNVDDDTFTMPEVAGIFTARIEIESERDGVVSWERQIRTFSYLGSYPIRGALVTDSASTSLTLDAETIVNWDTETSDWGGYFTAASADLAVPSDALGWHFMASNITHAAGAAAWHSGSFLLAKSGSPAWGSLNIGVYERPALTTAQARSYGGLAKANSGCILNQDVNWYGGSGSRSIAAGGTLGIAKMWADTVIGGQLTRTSTQSISHNTESTVTMTAEYVDDGGCIDIAGQPTRFTAPAAGWYIATGITKWPSTGTVSARGTYLRKNGSGPHVGSHRITVGNVTNVSTAPVASIVYLSASDYLELRTFHNNGAAVNLSSAYWQAARLDTSDTIGATVQYDGTAQTINTGSDVLITFDNEVIDDDGMVNLGSQAGRITATVEGLYAVVGHMGFATNTGTDRTLKLKVDGSTTIAEDCIDAPANHGAPIPNVSAIVYLTVGQYVSLYAATGTNTSSATGDHRPRLSMVLLAAA